MSYKDLIKNKPGIDLEIVDKFLNTAMTSTLQEEFYSKKNEQTEKVLKIHDEMLNNSREIYSVALMLPINDIQKMLIVKNLVCSKSEKAEWENNAILDTLKKMPVNRAYKLLYVLAMNKINNARAKWLSRQFLRERGEKVMFEAVKYKRLMKVLIKHFHIDMKKICKDASNPEDVERFLFEKEKDKIQHQLYLDYIDAVTNVESVYKLPYSVAEGFKALHKISDEEFMEKIKGKMSHAEKRRSQGRAERAGVKVEHDLSKDNPVNIQKFLRSPETDIKSIAKARKDFEKSCKKDAEKLFEYFDFERVKIIVDNSGSMYGSSQKKNHPISVAEATAGVLKYLSDETEIIGSPKKAGFLMKPDGQTDIAEGILKALKGINLEEDTLIVIISDGYENAPSGLSNQLLLTFKKKLDKKEKILIIQLNPVFAPEAEDIKKLSEAIQTYGIRDTRQLFLILLLAVIRNKKDKKIRQVIEGVKKKVVVRKRKKKKKTGGRK